MTTAAPDLLTVPEVMASLKVGRTKVYDLIRTHRLVSIKVDGCRRIPADSVGDFISRQIERGA
ncbi:helix-turn-helix domain-containing protein [Streptomyces sp. NPDC051287]|uniref:helix-turn-helix domain-containing protein n=1 Tax=Streptomyces sp. NPDC051287 TaxID=3365648 RepID=UPI0037B5E7D2